MIYAYKVPILMIIAGLVFIGLGFWAKIHHLSYADKSFATGFFTQLLGAFTAVFIFIKKMRK